MKYPFLLSNVYVETYLQKESQLEIEPKYCLVFKLK